MDLSTYPKWAALLVKFLEGVIVVWRRGDVLEVLRRGRRRRRPVDVVGLDDDRGGALGRRRLDEVRRRIGHGLVEVRDGRSDGGCGGRGRPLERLVDGGCGRGGSGRRSREAGLSLVAYLRLEPGVLVHVVVDGLGAAVG